MHLSFLCNKVLLTYLLTNIVYEKSFFVNSSAFDPPAPKWPIIMSSGAY